MLEQLHIRNESCVNVKGGCWLPWTCRAHAGRAIKTKTTGSCRTTHSQVCEIWPVWAGYRKHPCSRSTTENVSVILECARMPAWDRYRLCNCVISFIFSFHVVVCLHVCVCANPQRVMAACAHGVCWSSWLCLFNSVNRAPFHKAHHATHRCPTGQTGLRHNQQEVIPLPPAHTPMCACTHTHSHTNKTNTYTQDSVDLTGSSS